MVLQLLTLLASLVTLIGSLPSSTPNAELAEPQVFRIIDPDSTNVHFADFSFQSTARVQVRPLDEGYLYVTVYDKHLEMIGVMTTAYGTEELLIPSAQSGPVMIVVENFGLRSIAYTLTTTGDVVDRTDTDSLTVALY